MSKLIYQFVCQCLPHKNYRRRAVVKWVWARFRLLLSTESQEPGAETKKRFGQMAMEKCALVFSFHRKQNNYIPRTVNA